MTETSRFFSDGVYYTQEQFARFIKDTIADGYVSGIGSEFAVSAHTPPDMGVSVGAGRAYLQGYIHEIEYEPVRLDLPPSDPEHSRIDLIVARLSVTQSRTVRVAVLRGIPAENPVEPALTQTDELYETKIAAVSVRAGVVSITDEDIAYAYTAAVNYPLGHLPVASASEKGMVQIGHNLQITADGVLSADYAPFPMKARLYNADTGYTRYIINNVYSGVMGTEPAGIVLQNADTEEIHTVQYTWRTEFHSMSYNYHEIVSISAVDVVTLKTRELYHNDVYCSHTHTGSATVTPHLHEVCTISITGDNCFVVETKVVSDTGVWLGMPLPEMNR